jgi:hypothetical protein
MGKTDALFPGPYALLWNRAKNAPGSALVESLSDYPEIFIVARTFIRVALEAKGLEIGEVILTAVFSWHNMINLNSPLIRRDAA